MLPCFTHLRGFESMWGFLTEASRDCFTHLRGFESERWGVGTKITVCVLPTYVGLNPFARSIPACQDDVLPTYVGLNPLGLTRA